MAADAFQASATGFGCAEPLRSSSASSSPAPPPTARSACRRSATSTRRSAAAGAPGDYTRLYVVERGGTVRVVRGGAVQPTPFLRLTRRGRHGSERGLLSIAFPPDFQSEPPSLRLLRRRQRQHPRGPVRGLEPRPRRLRLPAHRHRDPAPGRANHNGGTVTFGPDGLMWLAPGDGARLRWPTRRAGLRCSARCSGSGRGGRRLRDPSRQPVRGQRRPRRDLGVRPAQPVPVLVRPRHRRPHDRRRRRGNGRGDRLRADAPRSRAGAANFGWAALRGELRAPEAPAQPCGTGTRPVIDKFHSDGWYRDHRRRGGARPVAALALRPLPLRRQRRRPLSTSPRSAPAGAATTRTSLQGSRGSPASARTRRAASTPAR